MEYTLAPLYVRIGFFITLGVIGTLILCIELKKHTVITRITVSVIASVIFILVAGSTVYSAINPQIESFTGVYIDCERGNTLNPMSDFRIFEKNGEKIYIEFDFITRNRVYPDEFDERKIYSVMYEKRENLIVAIKEVE